MPPNYKYMFVCAICMPPNYKYMFVCAICIPPNYKYMFVCAICMPPNYKYMFVLAICMPPNNMSMLRIRKVSRKSSDFTTAKLIRRSYDAISFLIVIKRSCIVS